ncbi:MAG: DUF3006 domain-containing protein [Bacteroidales bacterium]
MNAVVDRISEGMAVLLFGKEEYQVNLPVEFLPEGIKEGHWLDVDFSINENLTEERYRSNRDLLDKIRRKNRKK